MFGRRLGLVAAALLVASVGVAPAVAAAPRTNSDAMLTAMRRDLGLTADAARQRIAAQEAAARTDQRLRARLGAAYAGAWLDAGGLRLIVAVTDPGAGDVVRAAGAEPRLVSRGRDRLSAIAALLGRAAGEVPAAVAGWYVDLDRDTVVVESTAGGPASAFVERAGAGAALRQGAVRVVTVGAKPAPLYGVRGGDRYYINNLNQFCSVGFAVVGGFVTAGHCGAAGDVTFGYNQVGQQGTVRGRVFPGADYGWVAVGANWSTGSWVNTYNNISGNVSVAGAQPALVGAAVCRSGSRSGWHCGVIEATNASVSYAQGVVNGLTRTNVCAEPGDSGGSWVAGQQAQGVTSGGSGDCATGGTTYFQPIAPILAAYGLTLVVNATPPPVIELIRCEGSLTCEVDANYPGADLLRWTFDGVALTGNDGSSLMYIPCGTGYHDVTVTVSGATGTASQTVRPWCSGNGGDT